jgi:hypothetical protein
VNIRRSSHRRWGPVVAAALLSGSLLSTRSAAQEPFPGLDAYVTKAMADRKVPGLGVAAAVTSLFVRFDPTPDGKISSLMFALGADTAFFNRKPTPAPRAAGTP